MRNALLALLAILAGCASPPPPSPRYADEAKAQQAMDARPAAWLKLCLEHQPAECGEMPLSAATTTSLAEVTWAKYNRHWTALLPPSGLVVIAGTGVYTVCGGRNDAVRVSRLRGGEVVARSAEFDTASRVAFSAVEDHFFDPKAMWVEAKGCNQTALPLPPLPPRHASAGALPRPPKPPS